MKKLLSVLLICSLLMGLLSGCGLVETLQDKILYTDREDRDEKEDKEDREDKDAEEETEEPKPVFKEIPEENVLMVDYASDDETPFLRTEILRNKVLSLTFLNTTEDAPADAVDVSEYENGKVLAWSEPNGTLYDVYIAADGGMYAPEACGYLFAYLRNAQKIDFGNAFDTSKATDMWSMFFFCSSLTELDVTGFDTSNVTDMGWMFACCESLTELDVTGFDTSNVTDMSYLFYGCESLTELDVSGFDMSNVEDTEEMFVECGAEPVGLPETRQEEIPEENVLRSIEIVEDAAGEAALEPDFLGTGILRSEILSVTFLDSTAAAPADAVDVSLYESGSVLAWGKPNGSMYDVYVAADGGMYAPTIAFSLFANMVNVKTISFGDAFDTSNTENMSNMFSYCESLTGLDVTGFDTSDVTNMSAMFGMCESLPELDVTGFDTSNVTDMAWMFFDCLSLKELNVSSFDTSNVTDMSNMFCYCESLTELDVTGFDMTNVTNTEDMFEGCYSLPEEVKAIIN